MRVPQTWLEPDSQIVFEKKDQLKNSQAWTKSLPNSNKFILQVCQKVV